MMTVMSAIERLRSSRPVERIRHERLVAVLRRIPPHRLETVVDALVAGGVRIVEITLESEDAAESIGRLVRSLGTHVLVGAGTVRTPDDVDLAHDAGAAFCVGPTVRGDVVQRSLELDLPVLPGALTPTEIEAAWAFGASLVKLFPGALGGPDYVRDVHAPLPDVPLVVTGGVTADTAAEFLRAGAVAVAAGSSLVPRDAVERRDLAGLTTGARELVAAVTAI
jgi:2-dehydro-3-deoxyphosphogluconate aldolase/(4S)-4-hydroxy-2-oxoglutarate aldolase